MRVHKATRTRGWLATAFTLSLTSACGDGGSDAPADAGEGNDGGEGNNGGESTRGGNSNRGGAGSTSGGADAGALSGTNGNGDDGGVGGNSAGGNDSGGEGGTNDGGEGGTGGTNHGGEGGIGGNVNTGGSNADGTVAGIIAAVCAHEFRCCDAGERAYRLSPFATSEDECEERITFQLTSNNTNNPYVSGPAAPSAVLGQLAYRVNLSRVEVNQDGVDDCAEQWDALGCAVAGDPDARCEGPAEPDPCALTNIFNPILEEGDECTPELTESDVADDVECVEGTTCADVGDPDNPSDVPTCVQRGLEGEPCASDGDCDFDFYCDSGDCTLKGDAGDPCSFNDPNSPTPGEEDAQCKAGLSCHPVDFECVEACTLGFTCATAGGDADTTCPADSGCAPIEVDEATTAFRVCTALGDSAAALCNSDADCEANRYCDGANCQARKNLDAACTNHNECAEGLHCDLVGATMVNTCQTHLAVSAFCLSDYQCGPASAGCLNGGINGFICRNTKFANGEFCASDEMCASGLCEFADDILIQNMCVPGGTAGAACDVVVSNGDATRCSAGYLCFGEVALVAGGECVPKAQPGASCIDPDDNPSSNLCANGSTCDDAWGEGETCTDAPVSIENGGTNLTCDGS